MPRGTPLFDYCGARSRQSGEQCRRAATPFSSPARCIFHGSNTPAMRERARLAFEQYLRGMVPYEPDRLRHWKIQSYLRSEGRYQDRQTKSWIERARRHADEQP